MTIKRLFTQDPGLAELTSVSSIVVIDNAPPVTPLGAGTGVIRPEEIDAFRFQDFTLEGYDPHPAIRAPVAV